MLKEKLFDQKNKAIVLQEVLSAIKSIIEMINSKYVYLTTYAPSFRVENTPDNTLLKALDEVIAKLDTRLKTQKGKYDRDQFFSVSAPIVNDTLVIFEQVWSDLLAFQQQVEASSSQNKKWWQVVLGNSDISTYKNHNSTSHLPIFQFVHQRKEELLEYLAKENNNLMELTDDVPQDISPEKINQESTALSHLSDKVENTFLGEAGVESVTPSQLMQALTTAYQRELMHRPAEQTYVAIPGSKFGVRFLLFAPPNIHERDSLNDWSRGKAKEAWVQQISPTYDSIFIESILAAAERTSDSAMVKTMGHGMAVLDNNGKVVRIVREEVSESDPVALLKWYKQSLTTLTQNLAPGQTIRRFIVVENLPSQEKRLLDSNLSEWNVSRLFQKGLKTVLYREDEDAAQLSTIPLSEIQRIICDGALVFLHEAKRIDRSGWYIFDKPSDVIKRLIKEGGKLQFQVTNVDIGSYRPKFSKLQAIVTACHTVGVPDIFTPFNDDRTVPDQEETDFAALPVILGIGIPPISSNFSAEDQTVLDRNIIASLRGKGIDAVIEYIQAYKDSLK